MPEKGVIDIAVIDEEVRRNPVLAKIREELKEDPNSHPLIHYGIRQIALKRKVGIVSFFSVDSKTSPGISCFSHGRTF